MKLIKKIDETNKNKIYKEELLRRSSRAIIIEGNKLLVNYLKNIKEYKLPGGGVEKQETLIVALKREILEETGYKIKEVIDSVGKIDHKKQDQFDPDKIFHQVNYYYLCEVFEERTNINPSENEKKYLMEPRWVDIDDIINTNMKNIGRIVAPFSVRELFMFQYIKDNIIKKH